MKVNLESFFVAIDKNLLLQKLICPRTVKLGIFRFFNVGFPLKYPENSFCSIDLSILLSHVALTGVENLHYTVRFGYEIVFFLKPNHNECIVLEKLKAFFSSISLDVLKGFTKFKVFSTLQGFDLYAF